MSLPTDTLILNVDDNEAGRYAKTRTLQRAGFKVEEAATGAEALRLVTETKPKLVVLDVKLPDIIGYEVCRRIKADPQTAATLVLQVSATFALGKDRAEGLERGADAYLTEPMEVEEFLATINALLRMQRAEEERERLLVRERAARAEAEEANRLKDEFLATVSHELRTPLNAMLGWLSLLRGGRLDSADSARGLEVVERNAKMQAQLIEDLLDVSRIITGKLRLDVQPVDLTAVIEAAIETVRPSADARGIRLQRVLDSGAGPVSGDAGRLQQVVWNLLSNAIKFTPNEGRVQVRLERLNSHVEISVHDTGQGISRDFLPHVFERFRQFDATTTRSHYGLGLGLAIVRHLVELHGGTVQADSPGEGQGATFTVRLPLAVLRQPPADAPPAPPARATARGPVLSLDQAPALDGLRVMVVDDEADAREMLAKVLAQRGAEAVPAASVAEAMALLREVTVDVLISDIGLPEEDGYELIRQVRALDAARGRWLPAAALTAYARPEDRRRALLAGYQIHLPKPVEPEELVAVVANLAGRVGQA